MAAKNAAACLRIFAELSPENRTDRDPQSPASSPLTVPGHHPVCSSWLEDVKPRRPSCTNDCKDKESNYRPSGMGNRLSGLLKMLYLAQRLKVLASSGTWQYKRHRSSSLLDVSLLPSRKGVDMSARQPLCVVMDSCSLSGAEEALGRFLVMAAKASSVH